MSYQVLARKWRPKSFATLVGQEHVVRALTHALEQKRLHHAYLFTGTRGVGKTTLARILAKALNCEAGISATPCGTCSSCQEIDGGRFVDLIEVDAATNTKVDQMRDLLDNAVYAPTRGRFKVFVIDEVHMLSTSAFNAMLKTLEEPPEHIKFILATTDPQKIPVTVLSRCLQFNLKQMPPGHIVEHLTRILEAEQVAFEPAALRHIAKAAAGSMRDALSLLDQAIAHGAGRIEEAAVRDMLGTVGEDYLYTILDGLVAGDSPAMLAVADGMDSRSLSFDSALQELATLFHRIALAQFAPQAIIDEAERQRLAPYAAAFDREFLQLCYQIAIHGRDDLPLAPDEFAGFTMTLLRLAAFRPEMPALLGSAAASAPQTARTAPPRPAAPVQPAIPATAAPAPAAPARAAPAASDSDDWHAIADRLPLTGMARQLAQHCELAELAESQITLRLPPAHKGLLMNKGQQEKLQAELQKHFGRPLRLDIVLADVQGETPAARTASERRERQERAIAAIEQDPFVREVVDLFDASIDESTIKPV
ncbi:DNA polymerase III subunit gamma/tau [Sulfurisoma sediminicola]|uniref:DNA polymerase III subunit gamma/tau n=1 Tax=Sulfurisoma sediminicola TaxID=1381557 RepID=A0A497XH42_9PROT|nr:DNA polymerase III subunit gamma/tau [Sulfurisoma sediminicola]RLJ65307.1 DNA polymerase-3 subunit gamma/tau [Sulfurisoma sediminicola]